MIKLLKHFHSNIANTLELFQWTSVPNLSKENNSKF